MANYVSTTGPAVITIAANSWNTYVGGVLTVCDSFVNHAAQVVGVTLDGSGGGYWKIRNSWFVNKYSLTLHFCIKIDF